MSDIRQQGRLIYKLSFMGCLIEKAYIGWAWNETDYDGPPHPGCGHGASVEDCKAQIREYMDEKIEQDTIALD